MKTIPLVTVVAVLAAVSPAGAQNREHMQLAADLRIVQQQQQELANSVAQLTQLVAETAKALNTRMDQTNEAVKKGFADQSLVLSATAGDVRKIQAQTQDAATRMGELKEEIEALRTSIPALLTRLTPPADSAVPPDAAAVPPAAGAAPPPVSTAAPATLGLSPERMFNTAWSDYAAGSYPLAIQGLQEFLKTFPTSPRADDAQQLIGEAEYQQNHFDQAIAAYNQVIQNYPKGDQVAWAYYKRGMAQSQLQQVEAARASFEAVVKLFPDSEPAVLALSGLQRLDRSSAPPATTRKP